MSCTICQHPKRQDIDQALIAGSATLTALSQEYGLSTSALHRHKAHLQTKVNRAKDRLQDNLRQGCLFWLSQALEMAMQTAKAAQAEGNGKVVLQALQQGTRLLTIILKQDIHLDDRVVYEILASPQWTTQASLLPHDPRILAACHQSLTGELSSPCPETDALPSFPASSGDLDLNVLQAMFPTLAQPLSSQPKTANRKLKTQKKPFQPREKSGKLPGKNPLKDNNSLSYQEVNQDEKTAGKISQLSQPRVWLEDLAAGRLDVASLNAIGAGRILPKTVF